MSEIDTSTARKNVAEHETTIATLTAEHDSAERAYQRAIDEHDSDPSAARAKGVIAAREARDIIAVRLDRARARLASAQASEREAMALEAEASRLADLAVARTALDSAEHGSRGARAAAQEAAANALSCAMGATIGPALERLATGEQRAEDTRREAEQNASAARAAVEAARDRVAALDPEYAAALPALRAGEAEQSASDERAAALASCTPQGLRSALADVIAMDKAITTLRARREAIFAAALASHNATADRHGCAVAFPGVGAWSMSRLTTCAHAMITIATSEPGDEWARALLADLGWRDPGGSGSLVRLRACLDRGPDAVRADDAAGAAAARLAFIAARVDDASEPLAVRAQYAVQELHERARGSRDADREAYLSGIVADGAAALVKLLSSDANAQIKVADAYTTPAGHSGAARFERIPHGPWPGWDVKRRVAEYLGCNVDIVPDHKASQLAATPAEGLL